MGIFKDQAAFIAAMGQGKGTPHDPVLYMDLIVEEFRETDSAFEALMIDDTPENLAELIDGCIDLIYVTAGLLNSLGVDGEAAWAEVHRSNMSKMAPDGTVLRRQDGKILKPDTFSPPNLLPLAMAAMEGAPS